MLCGAIAVAAVVLAVLLTPWALVVVPFAVVIGIAAWNGIGVVRTLDVMGDSSPDVGSGPAGLVP